MFEHTSLLGGMLLMSTGMSKLVSVCQIYKLSKHTKFIDGHTPMLFEQVLYAYADLIHKNDSTEFKETLGGKYFT